MPQSFASLNYHFVFSTLERQPPIMPELKETLYACIGGIVRNIDAAGILLAAGGVSDHVHLLIRLGRELAVADAMRLIKTNSSKWVHETHPGLPFAWQACYGAFTASYSLLPTVTAYIQRQEEHHSVQSFQSEFRALLRKHEIEFDERYIWDQGKQPAVKMN